MAKMPPLGHPLVDKTGRVTAGPWAEFFQPDQTPAVPPAGSGDVVGPAGAVDERVAVFDGTTGKVIKDGGKKLSELGAGAGDVVGPAGATDVHLAVFDGVTGKRLKDGGAVPVVSPSTVLGPASAVDERVAVFDGVTGKAVKDGGKKVSELGNTSASYVLLDADAGLPSSRVLAGTPKQVAVTKGPSSVVLSTPQDLDTDSRPQFAGQGLGTAAEAGSALKVQGHAYLAQFDAGNSGSAKTIDWQNGNEQILLLTASVVLTFSNPKAGGRYVLRLKQGSGTPFTVTFPGTVVWCGAVTPTLSTTENALDLVAFYYDGTNYIGAGANAAALTQGLPENPLAVRHGGTGHFAVAAGDLFVGAADGTLLKLPVPDLPGLVLTADASVPGKVKWAPAAGSARVACSVYIATNFVMNTGSWYWIDWDSELWDDSGMHDNGNPSRITIPVDGYYLVKPFALWSAMTGGWMAVQLYKNGLFLAECGGWGPYIQPGGFVFSLSAGDYLRIRMNQQTGVAQTCWGGSWATGIQVIQVK